MFTQTLSFLKCPACEADLQCALASHDILSGSVSCSGCGKKYPILAGVLILVPDVRAYLVEHVKGISREVSDDQIPKEHRSAYLKAKREILVEHIEEDLESERVTALYAMNSYLTSSEVHSTSPSIEALIRKHWDHGPFAAIREQLQSRPTGKSLIELGCGIGGLFNAARSGLQSYLGLDSSFASIILARHFSLRAPRKGMLRVPHDLLLGPVSREVNIVASGGGAQDQPRADFIACELEHPPVKEGVWDMSAALNVIDMLPEPASLPQLQNRLLKTGGIAIQSSPYIWHQSVAADLRESLPPEINSSAKAVEWLYQQNGFEIDRVEYDVPWVFFKNIRQVELYSVHLFFASKARHVQA